MAIGIGLYFARRYILYIIANLFILIVNMSGLVGVFKCRIGFALIHSCTTMSLIGAFFIYQLIDAFAGNNMRPSGDTYINETPIILAFSIPYLLDFIAGCVTFKWCLVLNNEMKKRLSE
jgi:hypothetical protein